MSNLIESTDLLRRYTIARIPFIAVNTIEKDRCLEILKRIAADLQLSFYVSSLSSGIYDLTSGKHLDDDTTFYGAVMYMTEQMRRKQYLTLVLSEVPDLSTDNADAKQLLAMANLANQNGGSIIVISDNPVWDQLQRLGMTVKLDLPDEEEMYMIIRSYIDDYRNSIPIEWDNNDVREAASTLVGATKIEAENVIAALLANTKRFKNSLQTLNFLPYITTPVAIGMIFTFIFATQNGILNNLMQTLGLMGAPVNWLMDQNFAMKAVIILSVWAGFGNYMLYFVTGMTSISEDVYESSRIDGANAVQTFFKITLPMLSPVLKVVLMLAITGAFKDYEAIMVLTNGGPGSRTNVMFLYIFKLIFGTADNARMQIGYGALLSLMAAVIVGAVTILYNLVAKRLDDVV